MDRRSWAVDFRLSARSDVATAKAFLQERGSFAELIAREGRFADLVATQLAPAGPRDGRIGIRDASTFEQVMVC